MKRIYKIKGMDCASCAMLIEADLEDLGIKSSCSYAKETLEIDINQAKISEEKVRDIVKSVGYEIE